MSKILKKKLEISFVICRNMDHVDDYLELHPEGDYFDR